MILVFVLLLVIVAIFGPRLIPENIPHRGRVVLTGRVVCGFLALICILSTSIIKIPADQVGVVRKIYGAFSLKDGHVIAANGETGYQAEIIPPGAFHIWPGFNILNDIEYLPVVKVPQGVYARVVARDGAHSLRDGQIMADAWSDKDFSKFLDAQYFMENGTRGLQLAVLTQGTYPLNLKLFEVRIGYTANGKDILKHTDDVYDEKGLHQEETPLDTSITHVPAGFVGVVRSSVQETGMDCTAKKATVDDSDSLSAVLVPRGCKGIWEHALAPNDYYLNRDAYDITLVDTRVQTLEFMGGYKKRAIDLTIGPNGDFEQKERPPLDIPKGANAVDTAVYAKVEGWEIPQELRAVVQISPDHAPIIVAAVGGLPQVEDRIMVPAIRSHVRNVFGGNVTVVNDGKTEVRQTRVLDTVEQRSVLEAAILKLVQLDGRRAGVDVKEIRLGDSAIPPELLLARQRQQLAGQLREAFQQETIAQQERQKVAEARANADQQASLVRAQIGVKTADLGRQQRESEGKGESAYLQQIALGQQAQTNILGADKVFMFNIVDKVLAALVQHPEILGSIKLPQYFFMGGDPSTQSAGMLATSPALAGLAKALQPSIPPK